ncbi:hypothetical protein P4V58_30830 [Bacillus wiedmannii]|uniref:hypothetical protein n=1 Tax=Bacillus wiedmannii TaxID=1890302 RepID=UPI002E1C4EAD|nr:hypothetical protein [Bacillus wiedmannii]
MLKFHCHSCGEKFQIAFENLYNKIAVQCQNCSQPLPADAVKSLRDFSEAYMDTIDTLYKTGEPEECWSISIVGTEQAIPEKVHKFSFISTVDKESHWKHRRKPYVPDKVVISSTTSIDIDDDLPF